MDRYIAEQDQYQRFLVTGHNSKEVGGQNTPNGSQGVPLPLPYQRRGKVPVVDLRVCDPLISGAEGPQM